MLPSSERLEATLVAPGRLVVARYAAVDPARMVPVQTSIGRPRWVGFDVIAWPAVMPWGLFGRDLEPEEFRRAYRRRLHQRTPRILGELAELLAAYDPYPLALCCFEDLRDGSRWCHRTILAEWIGERVGVEVPDLEEVAATRNPSM
jgi:hypothetical protein